MDNKKKGRNILIVVLLLISAAAVCVTIWVLFFRDDGQLTPDYAPVDEEANAEEIPDDSGEKMEVPEGGGSVSLTYTREVSIDISDKSVSLLFANPGKSNQDIVLQLVIQDNVIVQSGTLVPGKQVTKLDLSEDAASKLSAGTYEGNFNVLYYDLQSGERAVVHTEIPVTIQVNE